MLCYNMNNKHTTNELVTKHNRQEKQMTQLIHEMLDAKVNTLSNNELMTLKLELLRKVAELAKELQKREEEFDVEYD